MKKIYETDPYLMPYKEAIEARHRRILEMKKHIAGDGLLKDAVNNHMYYGLHRCDDGSWVFREWAPNATKVYLIGDFNNWKRTDASGSPLPFAGFVEHRNARPFAVAESHLIFSVSRPSGS